MHSEPWVTMIKCTYSGAWLTLSKQLVFTHSEGQEAEGYLCDGAADSSPAGLRNLVSLQRAYHTIRGEEEHTVMVQALHDLIHAVVTLQLGSPHACNPTHPLTLPKPCLFIGISCLKFMKQMIYTEVVSMRSGRQAQLGVHEQKEDTEGWHPAL